MFTKIKKGSSETIQDLTCYLPPVGFVYNKVTKTVEEREIVKRSNVKKEQYWEREELPEDYEERLDRERKIQKDNPTYRDGVLDYWRKKFWDRRLNGMWFYNKGKPTYVTGLHWMYMNCWYQAYETKDGYPAFWESDRKFFYFIERNIYDPKCYGVVYVTRRREGKTGKSGVFIYDACSRMTMRNGGIQSKTEKDARVTVYRDALMRGFDKLPEFFRPVYDSSRGRRPASKLEFVNKHDNKAKDVSGTQGELGGWIEWRSSVETAFDSTKLYRYVGDEIFKTKGVNIRERHNVVKPCLADDNKPLGFALYTSTVEEIEGDIEIYKKFWEDSDQNHRNEKTGMTKTGLYRYFLSSAEAINRDIYGFCDVEKNTKEIMDEREMYRDDPDEYNSLVRKFPLTHVEAFRVSGSNSSFDTVALNDRLDFLSYQKEDSLYEVGDFVWENGKRDSKVVWYPKKNGRFKVRFLFDDKEERNNVLWKGSTPYPNNDVLFCMGVDPYDHKTTVDSRRSNAAAYIMMKHNVRYPLFSEQLIVEYIGRPQSPSVFYEDMIKVCYFYGVSMLFEDNKQGIRMYFDDRNYSKFLVKLKGRKDVGIPGSTKTHQLLAELTEEYIKENLDQTYYPKLIEDWIKFDLNNTTKFDPAMAAGYTFISNSRLTYKVKVNVKPKIDRFFRKRRR